MTLLKTRTFKKYTLAISFSWVVSLFVFGQFALAQRSTPNNDQSDSNQELVRARIISQDEARLSSSVPARIEQIFVREGERFKKGQLLVSLDCKIAEARLVKAKIELEAAIQNRTAREMLAQTRSVGELELELARISVRQVQSNIDIVDAELNQCRVLAPFDGVVAKSHFNQAEFVRLGEPLLEVFNDARLQAEFLVPSRWLLNLSVGDRIQIDIEELNRSIEGTIKRLGPRINPISQSLLVVVQLSGDLDHVLLGMSGSVRFLAK